MKLLDNTKANKLCSISIIHESDVFYALLKVRNIAIDIGFNTIGASTITTVASELGQNIIGHAKKGTLIINVIKKFDHKGIELIAEDKGPGIRDLHQVMQDGYTTRNTLGLGLPGIKRMVDTFEFDTQRKCGVKIIVRKWVT